MTEEEPVRRLAPISLIGIPLAVVAYLAQTIPHMGVFLMMLLAAAWPGLLLLTAMAGTALEAITGRVSRWWLLLPVLVVGAYEARAFTDHLTAWRLGDQEDVFGNIPASGRSIVIIGDHATELAERLVETRIVDAAYEAIVEHGRIERYVSRRLVPRAQCDSSRLASSDQLVTTTFFHAPIGPHGRFALDAGACVLTMDDVPTPPAITIRITEEHGTADSLPVATRVAVVSTPGSAPISIRSHASRPLSWFPFLLAGCGLDSATPSWRCGIAPIRERVGDAWSYGIMDRIALAMGLKERIPGTVPDVNARSVIDAAERRVASARSLRIEHDDELLDRLASDPATPLNVTDVERIARRPDAVGPRLSELEKIVDDARQMTPAIQRIPVTCAADGQETACRHRRIASNAALLDGLLRWRIDPSTLQADDRRALLSMRQRMNSRDRDKRQTAERDRMRRISDLRREEALRQRDPR